MFRNKKGFTLIELLAVVVVLAIIGIIVVRNVSDALEQATKSSFESTHKILLKEVNNRIKQKELGLNVEIECSDYGLKKCSELYDISAEDYEMKVEKLNDNYFLYLKGIGKFEELSYDNEYTGVIYTIINETETIRTDLNIQQAEVLTVGSKFENLNRYYKKLDENWNKEEHGYYGDYITKNVNEKYKDDAIEKIYYDTLVRNYVFDIYFTEKYDNIDFKYLYKPDIFCYSYRNSTDNKNLVLRIEISKLEDFSYKSVRYSGTTGDCIGR